ncbi:hypothetical protein F511_30591 [Dorcoceras hygrometricum]|uniref:Uncharacterized protein n=1 Tax=Dorcoceras hygrometricum TaxID=472368 RepID=A0A2Z7BUK6_9LAMI|nr:hypothetical protein F511_30591 [Dorcoceras hygrometricum]
MTSAVTSSFSRSYSDQQEDSADEKRCARYGMRIFSRKIQRNQQMLFGVSDSKTMSFTRKQQQHPVERLFVSAVAIYSVASYSVQSQDFQAQRIEEVAEDESSRSDDSAAKQLTTYQSWMSTAELNSNEESDKKPAKEKDAKAIYSRQRQLKSSSTDREVGATTAQLLKYIEYTVHQQRENKEEDEAIDNHSREELIVSIAESRLAC